MECATPVVVTRTIPGRLELDRRAGQVLRTSLGRRALAMNSLSAFGGVSAVIGFLTAFFRSFPPYPAITFGVSLAVCAAWSFARSYPRFNLRHQLKTLDVTVNIVIGDLFDQRSHLAVGFSDTFDTSVTDDRIINSSSLQGQLLHRLYGGSQQRLDAELTRALRAASPSRMESRADKPHGKLHRYPMGTVAVLGEPRRRIFAVAYGKMGNDLLAHAPVEDLWFCFHQLWEAVYRDGQRGALSIPLMGSGLARVDSLDPENLLKLILLSFAAYSRLQIICHDLRVVIRPADIGAIDLIRMRAFLQAL